MTLWEEISRDKAVCVHALHGAVGRHNLSRVRSDRRGRAAHSWGACAADHFKRKIPGWRGAGRRRLRRDLSRAEAEQPAAGSGRDGGGEGILSAQYFHAAREWQHRAEPARAGKFRPLALEIRAGISHAAPDGAVPLRRARAGHLRGKQHGLSGDGVRRGHDHRKARARAGADPRAAAFEDDGAVHQRYVSAQRAQRRAPRYEPVEYHPAQRRAAHTHRLWQRPTQRPGDEEDRSDSQGLRAAGAIRQRRQAGRVDGRLRPVRHAVFRADWRGAAGRAGAEVRRPASGHWRTVPGAEPETGERADGGA